jgi:hypothetical protein
MESLALRGYTQRFIDRTLLPDPYGDPYWLASRMPCTWLSKVPLRMSQVVKEEVVMYLSTYMSLVGSMTTPSPSLYLHCRSGQ